MRGEGSRVEHGDLPRPGGHPDVSGTDGHGGRVAAQLGASGDLAVDRVDPYERIGTRNRCSSPGRKDQYKSSGRRENSRSGDDRKTFAVCASWQDCRPGWLYAVTQRSASRCSQCAAGLPAIVRELRHSLGHNRVQLDRQTRPTLARHGRSVLEVRVDHRYFAGSLKRRLPDQALVEHARERVHVCTAVNLTALDLLGSDIVDGAEGLPPVPRVAPVGDGLAETEIRQVAVLASDLTGDQNVRRFHVTMDEAVLVRRIERLSDLRN